MASNASFEVPSGGLRDAMTCDVCLQVYDQASRTPLSLPCGHIFCRPCLAKLKASTQVQCPACRKQHNVQVEALPVNYPLLNITPLYDALQYEECTTHRDDLRYWCSTCDLALCSLCLHAGHPQDHSVKRTQVFVQEEKLRLEENLRGVYRTFEEEKVKLKDDFKKLDTSITELLLRRANVTNVAADLDDLLAKVQKAKDIATLKHLEKAVRKFRPAARMMSPSADKSTAGIMDDSGGHAATLAQIKALLDQQQQQPSAPSPQKRETTKGPGLVTHFRDDRLLLHSFSEPRSTGLSRLQVSPEVFLELSVGDRRLGCVCITLWSHMRLAKQFLALCMGTAEQYLKGRKAHGKVRDIIEFRPGGHGNGMERSISMDDVYGHRRYSRYSGQQRKRQDRRRDYRITPATDGFQIPINKYTLAVASLHSRSKLEWGGTHTKPEAEGYIMRTDANDGLAFGICTKTQHGVTADAPFGMVVAGLEVAREAFLHDPVTDVTVTDCGLVLSFPSLVPT